MISESRVLSIASLTSSYPWYTPYQFAGNKPIWAIDLDGLEEHFITSSGKDGYHKFCGGTVINVKDERWLYYTSGRGIFGGGFARIYDVEQFGGWSQAIEFNKHLQTGTGHWLSVGEYSRSTYTDPITSAFAMMFFTTTGSAILLPAMGSVGAVSMPSASTTVSSFITKGSGISFAADALAQTTFNLIDGKDPYENFNVVSSLSNAVVKNAYLANYLGSQFEFTLGGEAKLNSMESASLNTLVGGALGAGADKFSKYVTGNFRIEINLSNAGNTISVANPVGVAMSTFLYYFTNISGTVSQKLNDEPRP